MPSIVDNRKKRRRGRPRTGIGKLVGLRLYPELERQVDQWASNQVDKPGRPEAIRRLIEIALTAKSKRQSNREVVDRHVRITERTQFAKRRRLSAVKRISVGLYEMPAYHPEPTLNSDMTCSGAQCVAQS